MELAAGYDALIPCSQVVGMGEQWRGGDVVRYPGGGQKVNLLRPVLEQWKNQRSTIVMFVDRWALFHG